MDFTFGRYIHRVHLNKRPLTILEKKWSVGLSRDCQIFRVLHIISGMCKIVRTFIESIGTNTH